MSLSRGAMGWSLIGLYLGHFLVILNTHLAMIFCHLYYHFVSARPIAASRYDVTNDVNMTLLYLKVTFDVLQISKPLMTSPLNAHSDESSESRCLMFSLNLPLNPC